MSISTLSLSLAVLLVVYLVNAPVAWAVLAILAGCVIGAKRRRFVTPTALLGAFLVAMAATPASAQTTEDELRARVPYSAARARIPGLTPEEYDQAIREYAHDLDATVPTLSEPLVQTPIAPSYRRYQVPAAPPVSSTWNTYDWRSGNSLRHRLTPEGTTTFGTNSRTGAVWQQTVRPDGSMTGWDSNGNQWQYDPRTKTYMNFGTGQVCVGDRPNRVCSK
jgi:hypothetical protein